MSFPSRLLHLLLPAAALLLPCGCSQLDLATHPTWPFVSEDKPEMPHRIAAMWTDTVLSKANEPPVRGFGGRLYFYDQNDKAVKVDGSLVVYAFDETGRDPSNARPDRKFVFPKEHFSKHYSKSSLGHSYSVWIPWDKVGGEQKEISLIVRFLPDAGAPVVGQMTKHLLPGRPPEFMRNGPQWAQKVNQREPGEREVRPASHEAPLIAGQVHAPADGAPLQRMSSTTIDIPPRYGRQRPVATVAPRARLRLAAKPSVPERKATGQSATAPPTARQAHPAQVLPARQGPLPRQARFAPAKSRLPSEPIARPKRDRNAWPPRPATSPSALESRLPPVR
jgi:hypothetical protein